MIKYWITYIKIIQILIDEHFENPYFSDTLRKLDFEALQNLTFQQIILLHRFGFLNYNEINLYRKKLP